MSTKFYPYQVKMKGVWTTTLNHCSSQESYMNGFIINCR